MIHGHLIFSEFIILINPNLNVNPKILIEIPLLFLNVLLTVFILQLQFHIFHLWPMNQFPWYVNLLVPLLFQHYIRTPKCTEVANLAACPPKIIMFVKFVSIPSCPVYWILRARARTETSLLYHVPLTLKPLVSFLPGRYISEWAGMAVSPHLFMSDFDCVFSVTGKEISGTGSMLFFPCPG